MFNIRQINLVAAINDDFERIRMKIMEVEAEKIYIDTSTNILLTGLVYIH